MKTVIIGGVAAGMSVAAKLRREMPDAEILVYEKTKEISYGACGLPYYVSNDNPDINKMRIRSVEQMQESNIQVYIQHEVVEVDPNHKLIRGISPQGSFETSYDKLVVATGASPIILPIENAHHPKVFVLKSLEDGERLKQAAHHANKVAIIGGGYIGLELAEAFVTLKKQVTIIERLPAVIATFDLEFSQQVQQLLQDKGVNLALSETVTAIKEIATGLELVTDKQTIEADIVVMSVGIRPNTNFLEKTGIKRLANGAIITNKFMETSIKDIYAAGDCASVIHHLTNQPVYLPLGTNANKQGKILAEHLAGKDSFFETSLGTAMIKVIDLEVAKSGFSEAEAKKYGFTIKTATVTSRDRARYYPHGSPITIKLVVDAASDVILGVQLIGKKNVALRVNPFVVAMTMKMTAQDFTKLDFGYAPPFSSPYDVMHVAAAAIK